jgi:hypothetical protein
MVLKFDNFRLGLTKSRLTIDQISVGANTEMASIQHCILDRLGSLAEHKCRLIFRVTGF